MKPITIDELRSLAKKHDIPSLIIIQCDGKDIAYTSYGADRARCQMTHQIADTLMKEAGEQYARRWRICAGKPRKETK